MTQKKWLALLAAAAIAVGALWWSKQPVSSPTTASSAADRPLPWFGKAAPDAPGMATAGTSAPQAAGDKPFNPLDTIRPPTFRASSKGELVVDQQTRLDVERVNGLYAGNEAQQKLAEFSAGLPPKAQKELNDLYQQYAQYTQAVAQAFPPNANESTVDEARQQLTVLHELRNQYFGEDKAAIMFAEEEKTAKELLDLMKQHMSAEEAQAALAKARAQP